MWAKFQVTSNKSQRWGLGLTFLLSKKSTVFQGRGKTRLLTNLFTLGYCVSNDWLWFPVLPTSTASSKLPEGCELANQKWRHERLLTEGPSATHCNPTGIFQEAATGFSTQPRHTSCCTSPRLVQEVGCTAPQRIRPYLGKEKTERVNPPAPTWFVPNSWNVAFPMENDAIKITNNNNNKNNKITIGLFSKQTNTLLTYRNGFFSGKLSQQVWRKILRGVPVGPGSVWPIR